MKRIQSLLSAVLVTLAFLAIGISANTYDAPRGGFIGTPAQVQHTYDILAQNTNVPHFSEFAHSPIAKNCHRVTPVRSLADMPTNVLIVDLMREPHVVSYDRAYALTHRSEHSDTWVVGYCE